MKSLSNWFIPFSFNKKVRLWKKHRPEAFVYGFVENYSDECVQYIKGKFMDADWFSKSDVVRIVDAHAKFLDELYASFYFVDFYPVSFPSISVSYHQMRSTANNLIAIIKRDKDNVDFLEKNMNRINFVVRVYCTYLDLLDGVCVNKMLQNFFGYKEPTAKYYQICSKDKGVAKEKKVLRQRCEYNVGKIEKVLLNIGLFNNRQDILDHGKKVIESSPLYKVFGAELFGGDKHNSAYWKSKIKSCKLL